MFLQYCDTVGWVFRPVKTVARITYTVLVDTLNHAQSIDGLESRYVVFMLLRDRTPTKTTSLNWV